MPTQLPQIVSVPELSQVPNPRDPNQERYDEVTYAFELSEDATYKAFNTNVPALNALGDVVNEVRPHLQYIDAAGKVAAEITVVAGIAGDVVVVSGIADAVTTASDISNSIITDAENSDAICEIADCMENLLQLYADMPTLQHISGNIDAVKKASEVVSATGTLCTTVTGVLSRVAHCEMRMTRVELELLKLMGQGGTGGSGGGGTPSYDPDTGAYRGPVAVGTSVMDMQDAGVLFLFEEGASKDTDS